jgi:alkylation response protein AidB-like acyl-CoA dehydrogenase
LAEFMSRERTVLERALPGLAARILELPLLDREKSGSGLVGMFRDAGGPGLAVPSDYSGAGLDAVDILRVQRALGALSPSLAVATTMHSFSVAALAEFCRSSEGPEWMMLEAVASGNRLVASGFAEGRPGQGILAPVLTARQEGRTIKLSGSKKPCSLSHSMDILTASFMLIDGDNRERIALAMIPASSPGLERRPFWNSWVLAGAESDEVILKDVEVEERAIVASNPAEDGTLSEVDARGFLWFELLIGASYLGVASALAERAIQSGKGSAPDRVVPAMELEGAMAALEGLGRALDAHEDALDLLARSLLVRYMCQEAVSRSVSRAMETLGGIAFIGSSEVAYLLAAAHALAVHPPSRPKMWTALADALEGAPLRVQ